jgi:acyl dehydratase
MEGEEWLAHGGPDASTAEQIRALIEASIDTDRCGSMAGLPPLVGGPRSTSGLVASRFMFAELSGDDQWIHVDVERVKRESPFGTTIAHGNLALSLIDGFRRDLMTSTGFQLGVNYGWSKVRVPAPVPAGSRVRARAEVVSVDEVGGGWWQVVTRFTVEVEGSEKPCCVADSMGRSLEAAPAE